MMYRNIFRKSAFVALLSGVVAMTFSCKDEEFSPLDEKVLIKEINLEVTPELPLLLGTDSLIKYSVAPDNAFDKGVVWKSTVPDVASVNEEGRITALKEGEAVISAMPAVGYTVTSTITVKVVTEIIHITDITLTNVESLEVYETATLKLQWNTVPDDPTYPGLTWESLTPEVASVNEYGEVKGLAAGTAQIKATATDDKHFSKTFEIKVKPIIPIETLTFVKESDKLGLGEIYVPEVQVTPDDATSSSIQWSSSKPNVLEVDADGRFVAKSYGSADIVAKADYGNGKSVEAVMKVTVSEGFMNDNFSFKSTWKPFNNDPNERYEWIENDGVLSIFPRNDKQYKAVRMKRDGGFEFNVGTYPILAFKVKFPDGVYKASTSLEWYLDVWGSKSDANGKYGENTNKGNRAMEVIDKGDYQVFYADFTQKGLGTSNKFMPTTLTQYDTIELQLWKIWYESSQKGTILVDWVKTFASEKELKDFLKSEKN